MSTLYTVTVKDEHYPGVVEDLGFQMPYTLAEDFAADCNRKYGAVGRQYRATTVKQARELVGGS